VTVLAVAAVGFPFSTVIWMRLTDRQADRLVTVRLPQS